MLRTGKHMNTDVSADVNVCSVTWLLVECDMFVSPLFLDGYGTADATFGNAVPVWLYVSYCCAFSYAIFFAKDMWIQLCIRTGRI